MSVETYYNGVDQSIRRTTTEFVDLNSNFGKVGQPPLLIGRDAIKQMMTNILTSYDGIQSRIFEQDLKSGLMELLYEPISDKTALLITTSILTSLEKYMPYITVGFKDVRVVPNYKLPGYTVAIYCRINQTGSVEQFNYTLKQA